MGERAAATVLCAVLLGSCGDDAVEREREAALNREGHLRMVALLESVAARSGLENSYLGERALRQALAVLDGLPADARPGLRAHQLFMVGAWELRAGRFEEALAHLEAAEEALEDVAAAERPPSAEQLDYVLAVCHLRIGETANCVDRHTPRSCILPLVGDAIHVDQLPSRRAIPYLERVLAEREEGDPLRLGARWLLNVAYMTLGEHPGAVPAEHLIPQALFAGETEFPRFTDIAGELGLDTFDLCGSVVIEDFDGDGLLDLIHSTWDPHHPLHFQHNEGDGSFTEREAFGGITGGLNMVHADYDNDGDVDVLVLRGAWLIGDSGRIPNSLLANDGRGNFTDVTFRSGLGEAHYPSQTAAWADYDNDGDLDLFVGSEAVPSRPFPCQLFRNEGDGTFVDVAAQAGVQNGGYTKGVTWGDYDGDRFPDLYVSNLGGENRLYHNEGDGTFTDVAPNLGMDLPRASFPVWFWDYDNDGALDLYVTSYVENTALGRLAPVVASYLGVPHDAELPRLFRGDGAGGFEDVADEQGLAGMSLPMGSNFGDLDNDGYLDFYLGTGYPFFDGLTPNVMYHNRRGEGFVDVSVAGGFSHVQKGHGVAFADLDNDGDQDVFEQMGGAFRGDDFGNLLFENPGFGNHWIKVELEGMRSNRSAIGARLRVMITEDGESRSIYRHVNGGGSFGGNPLTQHIGIGSAERIQVLEVYWPTSDTTQRFEGLAPDRRLRIVEGEAAFEVVDEARFEFAR
ncbi:MAG: FG-GAP-like repeat-containing protein [Planctomycetota bacterium]|jgi:hypothetical protein|nr:FG-GAP-like repeat-containing protein [Planctomycetota bacterium]MDP6989448.1 FG-GAP-like repeat-containing protein [Planctomycetota bacterium]